MVYNPRRATGLALIPRFREGVEFYSYLFVSFGWMAVIPTPSREKGNMDRDQYITLFEEFGFYCKDSKKNRLPHLRRTIRAENCAILK